MAVANNNAREAKLTVKLRSVMHQLNMVRCKRATKWFQKNPNDRFSEIEAIKIVVD